MRGAAQCCTRRSRGGRLGCAPPRLKDCARCGGKAWRACGGRAAQCVRARWAPVRRSHFSTRWVGSGIPNEPTQPSARSTPRNRSCRIFRSAILRSGEIIRVYSRSSAWPVVVAHYGRPGCFFWRDSLPNYLGCMLSLMSAEHIIRVPTFLCLCSFGVF